MKTTNDIDDGEPRGTCGWSSDLPTFSAAEPKVVRLRLESFVRDAGETQVRAWRDSIPMLQRRCDELVASDGTAGSYTAILEYELPREARRTDVIVLENGVVVVIELKGKERATQADLDQVRAYARDLKCYHAECAQRPVHAVLLPTRAGEESRILDGVTVVGPAGLGRLLRQLSRSAPALPGESANPIYGPSVPPLDPQAFLREDAYRPLPTLVAAARALFEDQELPYIKRARAATDPAVNRIIEIAHEAAVTRTRRLILVTGVPGSGKTLVGLRLAHERSLDDLAVARAGGPPTSPAVFLSGNGPLVEVLQYALRDAGGSGKLFVQGVRDYVRTYSRKANSVPPEHVLIFDEAQRAFDRDQVAAKHENLVGKPKSEPELFIEFAERIPEWGVVLGLIGSGQEIHVGEEGGVGQWRDAIAGCADPAQWTVHAPAHLEREFAGLCTQWEPSLNLDTEIRYHLAPKVHEFVDGLLADGDASPLARDLGEELHVGGHRFLVTRSLNHAKNYARERYGKSPEGRYGLLASSKDKDLEGFGMDNTFQTTKRLRVGPWYNADRDDPQSCCRLETVATEFAAQGLELDLAVLGWGTDLRRASSRWDNSLARGYKRGAKVRDPMQLRRNAYRVLLTRGRDGTVVFLPPDERLDETYRHLRSCGFRELEGED
jgi:hypothetical protein